MPWNVPVKVLSTANRKIAFGQVESAGEAIAPKVVDKTTGDGDMDGMTSGGNINSIQVKAVLLATESQRMRYSRRTRIRNLPVSPRPPIQSAECPNGPARHHHRHGSLKIE